MEAYTDLPCESEEGSPLVAGIAVGRPGEVGDVAATSTRCEASDRPGLNRLGAVVLTPTDAKDAEISLEVWLDVLGREPTTCLDTDAETCIVARRQLRYRPHEELRVLVDLREDCVGTTCDETSTCVSRQCVRARIADSDACTGSGCGEGALGAPTDTPTWSSQASLHFDEGYLSCTGIDPITATTPRTVSLWVKAERCTDNSYIGLLGREDQGNGFRGWSVELFCDNEMADAFVASIIENLDVENSLGAGTTLVDLHEWYHLAVTYAGTGEADGLLLYLDGKPAKDAFHNDLDGSAEPSVAGTYIGNVEENPFAGWIDEVSIWNRVLSGTEIQKIFNGGRPGDLAKHAASGDLEHWFRMGEEGDANDIYDAVETSDARCSKTELVSVDTDVPVIETSQ